MAVRHPALRCICAAAFRSPGSGKAPAVAEPREDPDHPAAASAVVVDERERGWDRWPDGEIGTRGNVRWKTLLSADLTPTEALTAGIARICPGEELSVHSHSQPEIYIIIEGEATVLVGDEVHHLRPGCAAFIPGGTRHGCRNEGDRDLRFAYCFPTDSAGEIEYRFDGEKP